MYLFSVYRIDLGLTVQVGASKAEVSVSTFVGNAPNAEAAAEFAKQKAHSEDFGGAVLDTRIEAISKAPNIPFDSMFVAYDAKSSQLPLITSEMKGVYIQ